MSTENISPRWLTSFLPSPLSMMLRVQKCIFRTFSVSLRPSSVTRLQAQLNVPAASVQVFQDALSVQYFIPSWKIPLRHEQRINLSLNSVTATKQLSTESTPFGLLYRRHRRNALGAQNLTNAPRNVGLLYPHLSCSTPENNEDDEETPDTLPHAPSLLNIPDEPVYVPVVSQLQEPEQLRRKDYLTWNFVFT